jgi:hypothetical protein
MTVGNQDSGRVAVAIVPSHSHQSLDLGFGHVLARALPLHDCYGNATPDPPVPGALRWLCKAMEDWDVQIYSGRSRDAAGIAAMKAWLLKHATDEWGGDAEFARTFVEALKFPTQKPYAFLMIDDRAICFQGKFDELDPKELLKFKPWNKRDRA